MRIWSAAFITALSLGIADAAMDTKGHAQTVIVLKSGESVELHTVYYISNCRSIMVGLPQVEVLEGPPQVSLTVQEGMVLPRNQNCSNRVPGGTVTAIAKDVQQATEAKLTYRVKYKTKDGDRQRGHVYRLSLFP